MTCRESDKRRTRTSNMKKCLKTRSTKAETPLLNLSKKLVFNPLERRRNVS